MKNFKTFINEATKPTDLILIKSLEGKKNLARVMSKGREKGTWQVATFNRNLEASGAVSTIKDEDIVDNFGNVKPDTIYLKNSLSSMLLAYTLKVH